VEASIVGDARHLRPKGVLWFGTARSLDDVFLNLLAEHPRAKRLRIDLGGLGRIDVAGALALKTLADDARVPGRTQALKQRRSGDGIHVHHVTDSIAMRFCDGGSLAHVRCRRLRCRLERRPP
jgi:MFS superfamily sulfate permease-like transporter